MLNHIKAFQKKRIKLPKKPFFSVFLVFVGLVLGFGVVFFTAIL